jgi:hypothetical protein
MCLLSPPYPSDHSDCEWEILAPLIPPANRIYARDTNSRDFIDCGAGFDRVETIHRDDRTLSNCERALGPRQGDI